jgi:DNA integrity scanning protein DisA with diadenylate cyclase activity
LSLSKQLILNPFRGYPDEERNILDPSLEETIKELSVIDGAFLIRGDGVVESAGVYLRAFNHDEYPLPQGLGARHHAAAAITAVSEAVAITVSESTGTVTIFRNGQIITEVEKPRSAGMARRL